MERIITIRIKSKSKEAIEWAAECIEENIRQQQEWRRGDTDDPDIVIEIKDEKEKN